jgi:hypothetical protein
MDSSFFVFKPSLIPGRSFCVSFLGIDDYIFSQLVDAASSFSAAVRANE